MKAIILGAAMLAASTALAHENHDHATGVVRDRMTTMEQMGKLTQSIHQRLKANKGLEKISGEARAIEKHASLTLAQFPKGSTQHPTAARPEIWTAWPDFELKNKRLETEAAKLADMPTNDVTALREQFRAMTQTCSGCHETYRVSRQRR